MADFLDQKLKEIDKRLGELRPLHDEYLKLQKARDALRGVGSTRRGPGRPRGSGRSANVRRRRRRRGGTRADQALKVVRQNPGITVTDLAKKMNVKQKNYLYRVMHGLEDDGAVRKEGRGFVAK